MSIAYRKVNVESKFFLPKGKLLVVSFDLMKRTLKLEIDRILAFVSDSLKAKLAQDTGWTSQTCKELGIPQKNLSIYANKGIGNKVTFRNIFFILTALCGKPPLLVKNNELLPNISHCAKSGKQEILQRWLDEMQLDDMDVVYQLMELIKFKQVFSKGEWGLLIGAVTVLRKILFLQVPPAELLLTNEDGPSPPDLRTN